VIENLLNVENGICDDRGYLCSERSDDERHACPNYRQEKRDNPMWIFTQNGFISAVRHYSQPQTIVVRARDRESLEVLATTTGVAVERTPVNDYPYRVHVPQEDFSRWLENCVNTLDYTNFKDRVHDTRGDNFASTLMSVWETMHNVEDDDARTR
jgi:hypothetical protein